MNDSLRTMLLALFCCAAASARAAHAQEHADRVWTGGALLTMNDAAMRAEAIAERGGRILAVGSAEEVLRLAGPSTRRFDLGGRALVPGFVDAHGHVMMGGLQALSANLLAPPDGGVVDIASLQATLHAWIEANAEAVKKAQFIVGFGYDNAMLAELRHPTRDDLDQVSRDLPLVIIHQSGHLGAANSKALELAGITAESPNPPGGVIRRREGSNEPDGVVEETALAPLLGKLLAAAGREGLAVFARAGAELWCRYGYTTAQDGRAVPATAEVLRGVADAGGFLIDVNVYPDVLVDREYIAKNRSAEFKNRLRVVGAKLTIDGSPQGFTAWRDRPYHAPVGSYPPGYAGYYAAEPKAVLEALDWAYANGVQIITHANGEAAMDLLLAGLRGAEARHGAADRRPVVIHGQFMRLDQLEGFNGVSAIPSLFPMHTFYWGDWHRDHTVGPALADDISPTGWCKARGIRFTSHHDAPVAFPDSMRVLDATVTRRTRSGDILGPEQRVDVITALKSMTLWSAYQHFEETTKGSLEVGKLADFVILSQDPTAIDPETLDGIQIIETIKEGVSVYTRSPESEKHGRLMLRPTSGGDDVFGRFLATHAAHRDYLALAPEVRDQPRSTFLLGAAGRFGPHDRACALRAFDELTRGMSTR